MKYSSPISWVETQLCNANLCQDLEWKWKSLSHVQLFAAPWNSPGHNSGVGSLSFLQGIFPTQGWNPGLLHCRQINCLQCRRPWFDPGLGRSQGEGIGCPLQYSWASLVVQLVKNPCAMREIPVWSLGWEDTLEKGKSIPSSILAWRIPWTVYFMGSKRVGHNWATFAFIFTFIRT